MVSFPTKSPLKKRDGALLCLLASSGAPLGESFQPPANTAAPTRNGQEKTSTGRRLFHKQVATSSSSSTSSSTVLNSFSYLGDLGVDGYGSGTTTTAEPQLQMLDDQTQQQQDTLQFFEDVALPAPSTIPNPYDGATGSAWIPEEVETQTSTAIAPIVSKPKINTLTQVKPQAATKNNVKSIWETSAPTVVQGTSLRTWNFRSANLEAAQVLLKTNGRPLHAEIELWQGENHTPQKIAVYTENGEERPFSAFLATPFAGPSAIAVKNSANSEFPLQACVEGDLFDTTLNNNNNGAYSPMNSPNAGYGSKLAQATLRRLYESANPRVVQGDGAAYVVPLEESVARVQVLITTEERPLSARIELLQGPNNVKQVIEVSTEDGKARPFFAVLETPGLANAMRIVNTGPVEFPIDCRVEPFSVVDGMEDSNYFFDTVDATGQRSPSKSAGGWNVFDFLSGKA